MLFTQFNLEDAKKIWHEEAVEEGREEGIKKGIKQGIEQGEKYSLLKLVQRKLKKGKSPEQIAEELEEPLESIMQICSVMEEQGIDTEVQDLYECIYNS